jgi:hypothetical protein
MADAGTTRSSSTLLLVIGTGVLMLACGALAYVVVRDSPSGSGASIAAPNTGDGQSPQSTTAGGAGSGSTVPGDTTSAVTTAPATVGYTLDAPTFSVVLPALPEETQETSSTGSATVPATRWTVDTDPDRIVVYSADYSQVVAAGGFDVQALFDSIVAAGGSVAGATVPTNESITIGTDLGRRAVINTSGKWTYITLLWHGSGLLAIVADTTADQPPAVYTTAVESLVWKDAPAT